MHKLALCAVFTALVACGGNSDSKVHIVTDSGSGSDATCNPLAQTGCNAGEKCTWVYDLVSADGTNVLGHVGCAPEGDKAVGAQCTRNPAGAQGYDDCTKVGFCKAKRELVGPGGTGVCEQICDNNGGDPMCGSAAACVAYHNIFEVSALAVAGVCDVKCDPFADNDPLHGDNPPTRTGTKCQTYEGCYGNPGQVLPTSFSCAREYNTDLHDRDECTTTSGNSMTNANPLGRVGCATASNGCAQGYMPILFELTGSMVTVCTAMCQPKSCWMGNCGGTTTETSNLTGDPAGRQCVAGKILANTSAFHQAQPGQAANLVNGDQCLFNWRFEIDGSNVFHSSQYDDTAGWCYDHSQYKYDSNADGVLTADDSNDPKCDTIPMPGFGTGSAVGTGSGACTAANGCIGAGNFGCTSVTDSGLLTPPFQNNNRVNNPYVPLPRPAYGVTTQL